MNLNADNLPKVHLFEPLSHTDHVLITSHRYASEGFHLPFQKLKQPVLDTGVAIATFDYRYQQDRKIQEQATITSASEDMESVVRRLVAEPHGFTKIGIYADSLSGLAALTTANIPEVEYIIFDSAVIDGPLQVDIVERCLKADKYENRIIGGDILSKKLIDEVREFDSRELLKDLPQCLLLYKKGDRFVPSQHGIFAKELNPNFDLHITPGGKHFEKDPAKFDETKERILEYVFLQHSYDFM